MNDPETSQKLDRISYLLIANLVVMGMGAAALIVGLLPKLERITQSSERVEKRFQSFADDVQPVVSASAGKAIESIEKIDADEISRRATDKSNELIDAAAEKAKRYLEKK